MRESLHHDRDAAIIVCGHVAVDIIPRFAGRTDFERLLTPGSLVEVGAVAFSTGGAVCNTGIALHRLGAPVRLIGKVGDDRFGALTMELLKEVHPDLARHIVEARGESSSYTIVISLPGTDRIFLHCPGTNDTFSEVDIAEDSLQGAKHFHFGYPPLMREMYADGGEQLARLMRRARKQGMTTSLDMAMPGSGTEAYRADWPAILAKVLPDVDIFMPSIEEMLMMNDREKYEAGLAANGDQELGVHPKPEIIRELAERILEYGCGVVVLKLGEFGLYFRSSGDASIRLSGMADLRRSAEWNDRELWMPCFKAKVAGTTGAGDCTIAGFLKGLKDGLSPEETLRGAVAVGACSVESADATSGIVPWEETWTRVANGWEQLPLRQELSGWTYRESCGIWTGPLDHGFTTKDETGR